MDSKSQNPWWLFVQQHKCDVKHVKSRKEQFRILSEMWQERKSKMITINADDLLDLQKQLSVYKTEHQKSLAVISDLEERIMFLEGHMDDDDICK